MNDFDYDVLQKKRIAAGARHMRRGSRSKRCSLPSDNLTPAQLKRRNGPVSTYKLDAPMMWDDFKAMPVDLQKKYLTNLVETYGATNEMLGDMFYVHPTHVGAVKKALGVISNNPRHLSKEKKTIRDQMWAAFCNGVVGGGDAIKETPREPEKVETLPVRCPDELEEAALTHRMEEIGMDTRDTLTRSMTMKAHSRILKVVAEFEGDITPDSLVQGLQKIGIPEGKCWARVEIETI